MLLSGQDEPDTVTNAPTSSLKTAPKKNPPPPKKKPQWDPNKNHGKYGSHDYWGCPVVSFSHENLKVGDYCPDCLTSDTKSKLQARDPGVIIQLQGNPLITGTRLEVEKLYCVICNNQYTATVPEDILQRPKYDVTCYTAMAIARYYIGIPFKRLESSQAAQGVPLADATQWDKMDALYQVVEPIVNSLKEQAANGELIFYDDTPNCILEQKKRYKNNEIDRKGVYTTAIVSRVGEHEAILFCTGSKHAGDNMGDILKLRSSTSPLITMSDASSNNTPKDMDDDLLVRWIMCFCLVHGRRKFFDICNFFETACDFVLGIISKVYKNEAHCVDKKYSDEERLSYHQEHSAPLMESLHAWLNNQLVYLLVESNSGLGQAVKYMLKHWQALTQFLQVAGAPIDNSVCERAIKVAIRHRRNSLFFKTSRGAEVGDGLMGLIHTAVRYGVSPYDYLNQLQCHAVELKRNPERWLPWNYQASLEMIDKKAA